MEEKNWDIVIKPAKGFVKINLKDIDDSRYINSTVKKADLIVDKASNNYKQLLRIINKEL